MCSKTRTILDIGTGRLQSVSCLFRPGFKYILCDPFLEESRIPERIRYVDITYMTPTSILSSIGELCRGTMRCLIYRKKCEELLRIKGVIKLLVEKEVPAVHSFTLSQTLDAYKTLRDSGISQTGCCYMYDSVAENGVLVDVDGISMVVTKYSGAKVTFPDSGMITEYPITTSDVGNTRCTKATAVVECKDLLTDKVSRIIDNLYIVV